MSESRFVEIAVVHTHFYVAHRSIPEHTTSSYRDVFVTENDSFFYEDGNRQVAISRLDRDGKDQEHVYEQHVRLPITPDFALELAMETTRSELSAATDALIIELMTRRFDPSIFAAFLEETAWKDSGAGHHAGLYVFEHPDYPLRQIIYARTPNSDSLKHVDEGVQDAIRKLSDITGRPELGIRLDLMRRVKRG